MGVTKDADSKLGSTLPLAPTHDRERGRGHRISLLIYDQQVGGTQVVTLAEDRPMTIGRDPQAAVTVNDQGLSRRHARFEVREGEVWVEDLGSTNGTSLNGELIQHPTRMSVGDEVTMGGVTASIHVLPPVDLHKYGLDTHDHFLSILEHEVERARTFDRPMTLMMLQPRSDPAGDMAGDTPALREHLRPVDRLALYSDNIVEVLLPEVEDEAAEKLAQTLIRAPDSTELVCSIAVYPDAGTSADALLDGCREALRQASRPEPVKLASETRRWGEEDGEAPVIDGLVIRNPAMREVYDTIQRLARSMIPVLVFGETGTGKEVLARLIHESGPRAGKRMVSINCGAIPATLVESVLFGHEKGAFTGATQSSKGIFEDADGGTVLLDEVGELSASAQAALLRVLETKQITRVGSSREIAVDVRIIAATNRDLEAMCQAEESFRWDLYYRLNVMTLKVPPLRERPDEVGALAELFIRQANEANGCNVRGVAPDAMRRLHQYPWPGNVRELRNAIERAVVIARGDMVEIRDLPQRVRGPVESQAKPPAPVTPESLGAGRTPTHPIMPLAGGDTLDFKVRMQRYEAQLILDALRRCSWNRAEASRMLNMPVRTLSHKINLHGIKKLGYALDEGEEG